MAFFVYILVNPEGKTYVGQTSDLRRRLRQVAQVCRSFSQRVQKSVFECSVNEMQLETMRQKLLDTIRNDEDSLRIYRLLEPRARAVEAHGRDGYVDFHGPMVV